MKKIFLISVCLMFILCGCSKTQKANFHYTNDEQIEKEILSNLDEIHKIVDITSSNPYDYTKNEYYENIVNLGVDATKVLENMYDEGKLIGVDAYLSALVIQEIKKCDLAPWSTAEEFYTLWKDSNCK